MIAERIDYALEQPNERVMRVRYIAPSATETRGATPKNESCTVRVDDLPIVCRLVEAYLQIDSVVLSLEQLPYIRNQLNCDTSHI
jgi:hypothetical protein